MSNFVIENDVPLPADAGTRQKYPFGALEVGDSFFVAGVKSKQISGTAAQYSRRHGIKLIVRTEGDGVRVWRGEDPVAEAAE